MITSSRTYNENYYLNRKKILQEFLKDEENETMKYIDDTENLVSSTKMILKGVVTGDLDYNQIKEKLQEIDNSLTNDCIMLNKELEKLTENDKEIEKNTLELQKQEEKGTEIYLQKIEQLKNELENKEFTIQNMERLYIELENIIKDNLKKGNEQLLSLEQFDNFVSQNDRIKKECDELEEQKNNLLRENLNLKSKDESFELEKIKDVLEEISTMGNLHKEAESRIRNLQERYFQLTKECNGLTEQIKNITKTLEGLNIDNPRLNKEINIINKELYPFEERLNRTWNPSYENEDWKDVLNYLPRNNNKKKLGKHKPTKTSLI